MTIPLFLTIDQTQAYIQKHTGTLVARRTLAGWRTLREVLPYIKVGKQVRYSREDLDNFIAECRREPKR